MVWPEVEDLVVDGIRVVGDAVRVDAHCGRPTPPNNHDFVWPKGVQMWSSSGPKTARACVSSLCRAGRRSLNPRGTGARRCSSVMLRGLSPMIGRSPA